MKIYVASSWRNEHLQLELHSFRIAMWPDLPQTKKTNQ